MFNELAEVEGLSFWKDPAPGKDNQAAVYAMQKPGKDNQAVALQCKLQVKTVKLHLCKAKTSSL